MRVLGRLRRSFAAFPENPDMVNRTSVLLSLRTDSSWGDRTLGRATYGSADYADYADQARRCAWTADGEAVRRCDGWGGRLRKPPDHGALVYGRPTHRASRLRRLSKRTSGVSAALAVHEDGQCLHGHSKDR